jgi:hypothetical protein
MRLLIENWRKFLLLFCLFLMVACPKKSKNDVSIPEMERPEKFEELLDELEGLNLDDFPEDTADE